MLSSKAISIDELRTNLSEIIGRVMYGRDRVIIKKYNRQAAVLMGMDEYRHFIDSTKGIKSSASRGEKSNFSDLCGVWSEQDLEKFERATEGLEKIDRELWQ